MEKTMPDREKTIKGLNHILMCVAGTMDEIEGWSQTLLDAIKLLSVQRRTYPTWIEYFTTIGLCEKDGDGYRICVEKFNQPMDDSIARKLGVGPKEVEE